MSQANMGHHQVVHVFRESSGRKHTKDCSQRSMDAEKLCDGRTVLCRVTAIVFAGVVPRERENVASGAIAGGKVLWNASFAEEDLDKWSRQGNGWTNRESSDKDDWNGCPVSWLPWPVPGWVMILAGSWGGVAAEQRSCLCNERLFDIRHGSLEASSHFSQ